jgi:hypothetical protein
MIEDVETATIAQVDARDAWAVGCREYCAGLLPRQRGQFMTEDTDTKERSDREKIFGPLLTGGKDE